MKDRSISDGVEIGWEGDARATGQLLTDCADAATAMQETGAMVHCRCERMEEKLGWL